MKNIFYLLIISLALPIFQSCKDKDDMDSITPDPADTATTIYFPAASPAVWTTKNPANLNWDIAKMNALKTYLSSKNTKGFIILKNGRIVMEEYFNLHNKNAKWNWYSAAKSLTSTMVGIAEGEGKIHLDSSSSVYLGKNWSSLTSAREDSITVKHHITMSTGLKNAIALGPWTCVQPSCFNYQAPVNTRWAYYQGGFTQTQHMVTAATGTNFKQYCKTKIQDEISMDGSWSTLGDVNIFSSTTRSMARFGLLVLNKGKWNGTTVYPESYHNQMIQTSQSMNKAYGYLWWLNGKTDFLGTANQTLYNGYLVPNGPADMICALGLNDQKIYVVPSQDLVIVRMGESAGNAAAASSSFDNELWGKLNEIFP